MGTFFTAPQSRPADRVRIFSGADATLRRTGESVYLSPEGARITSGGIGRFNKGAFHLATSLRAPIVPLYIEIPPESDPGRGYDARPGTVHVHVKPAIDTSAWRLADLAANTHVVRRQFVQWHREHQGAGPRATPAPRGGRLCRHELNGSRGWRCLPEPRAAPVSTATRRTTVGMNHVLHLRNGPRNRLRWRGVRSGHRAAAASAAAC